MPKLLNIITNPNPILSQKSKNVKTGEINSSGFQVLIKDMILTMLKKDGIGLAAPQIEKNIRIIIINTKDGPISMINPRLIKKSWQKEWGEEGCLSVPKVFGQVKRHKKIICGYLNHKNEKKIFAAQGLMARVIQHEIDHLDGVLFIDKIKKNQVIFSFLNKKKPDSQ